MSAEHNAAATKPIEPKVNELIDSRKSIILATVDAEGNPTSSYAPFARSGNKFYILVSFMARHTKNLKEVGKVSAMFIEDESETNQIYARHRLTLDVSTAQIERETPEWEEGVAKLQAAHGKILDILVGMQDFIMIELSTIKGAYVNGFGSAFFVDENLEIMNHRNDINHTPVEKSSK